MEKSRIGNTGLAVTKIGFGTAALGGMPDTYGYGVDEGTARAALHDIFNGPVNLPDTSCKCVMGRSEARIGAVIGERGGLPSNVVISTKVDRNWTPEGLMLDKSAAQPSKAWVGIPGSRKQRGLPLQRRARADGIHTTQGPRQTRSCELESNCRSDRRPRLWHVAHSDFAVRRSRNQGRHARQR